MLAGVNKMLVGSNTSCLHLAVDDAGSTEKCIFLTYIRAIHVCMCFTWPQ